MPGQWSKARDDRLGAICETCLERRVVSGVERSVRRFAREHLFGRIKPEKPFFYHVRHIIHKSRNKTNNRSHGYNHKQGLSVQHITDTEPNPTTRKLRKVALLSPTRRPALRRLSLINRPQRPASPTGMPACPRTYTSRRAPSLHACKKKKAMPRT